MMSFWQGVSTLVSTFGRGFRLGWGRSSPPIERTDSDSGIVVTHEKALTLSAYWACVGLAAETIASFPCITYSRDADGKNKRIAVDHELYSLLHDQPNANMTAYDFWCMMVASRRLWGNGYAEVQRIGSRIVALDPWLPQFTSPYISDSGVLRYRYSDGITVRDLPSEDVFHIKGFSLDGLSGLSPLECGRNSLGRALSLEESAGKMFKNGLMPSTVFTYPHLLSPRQRKAFRASINKFTGAANAGKPFILEKGMEMKGLSMKPADAEMLLSRGFTVEDVCRWHRTPPPLIGHMDKASSWASSLEGLTTGYYRSSIGPECRSIEMAILKTLVRRSERKNIYAKFNADALLRADTAARATLYSSGAQNGWMLRNEIRALEDLEPIEGGDIPTAQSNLLPLAMLGQQAQGSQEAARNAVKAWLFPELMSEETKK